MAATIHGTQLNYKGGYDGTFTMQCPATVAGYEMKAVFCWFSTAATDGNYHLTPPASLGTLGTNYARQKLTPQNIDGTVTSWTEVYRWVSNGGDSNALISFTTDDTLMVAGMVQVVAHDGGNDAGTFGGAAQSGFWSGAVPTANHISTTTYNGTAPVRLTAGYHFAYKAAGVTTALITSDSTDSITGAMTTETALSSGKMTAQMEHALSGPFHQHNWDIILNDIPMYWRTTVSDQQFQASGLTQVAYDPGPTASRVPAPRLVRVTELPYYINGSMLRKSPLDQRK